MSLIDAFKLDNYRYGDCQAIPYDRRDHSIFPPGFLGQLYFMLRGNRFSQRDGTGILEALFCGFTDLSYDAVVSYLASQSLVILGVWRSGKPGEKDWFEVAGFCFPVTHLGSGNQKACFGAYGFVRKFWGTDELDTLTVLGLAQFFGKLDVLSVHGIRYADNDLTARLMERFGFRDCGEIPHYMLRGDSLVSAIVSTLSREAFEAKLVERALEAYRNGQGRRTVG